MTILQFGKVQLRIMNVLWRLKRATAREITDELNKQSPIAHSTVQTLLRTLEDKGAVNHEAEGRTFFFFPVVGGDQVIQTATDNFIEHIFGGSPGSMISYLVKNEYLSPQELKEIAKLLKPEE